jgi:integrase
VYPLTPAAVRAWYSKTLVDRHTLRSHAYGLLNLVCNAAMKDGLLERNPCQIEGAGRSKTKREINFLSVERLAELAETIRPESKALVLISAWCGLRYGEATELKRGDISAEAETVTISRAVVHREGCKVDTPKTGKGRTVVIPPHIRPAILSHLAEYVAGEDDSLLFAPKRGGCHLSDKVVRDAIKTLDLMA